MLFKKVSIIGVGLIGGSIGMACRKNKIAKQVIGIGRRASSINKALRLKAIDKGTLNLKSGIHGSDLIIVATPVSIVVDKIKECVKSSCRDAIIIDVSSVKADIVKKAEKIVKRSRGVSFVGTHPMAGSEENGVLVAKPGLFENSVCIITPTADTKPPSLKKVKKFWQVLGARVKTMPAQKHDILAARISHLPHLLAFSLCSAVSPDEMRSSGNSFRDMTRVAKSDPAMWADIFLQNKTDLKDALSGLNKSLSLFLSDINNNRRNGLLKKISASRLKRISVG